MLLYHNITPFSTQKWLFEAKSTANKVFWLVIIVIMLKNNTRPKRNFITIIFIMALASLSLLAIPQNAEAKFFGRRARAKRSGKVVSLNTRINTQRQRSRIIQQRSSRRNFRSKPRNAARKGGFHPLQRWSYKRAQKGKPAIFPGIRAKAMQRYGTGTNIKNTGSNLARNAKPTGSPAATLAEFNELKMRRLGRK